MNNEEKILKYFSGNLSPEEKNKIEREIENSDEVKAEYLKAEKMLLSLKSDAKVETEENYFINLVPKVRSRMEKKKRQLITLPRLAFIIPAITAIFILFLTVDRNNNENVFFSLKDYSEKLDAILEEATNEQLSEYIDVSAIYSAYSENNFDVLSEDLEISVQHILSIGESTLKSFDEYELINNLSEEEVNEIYNKLLNTKIL